MSTHQRPKGRLRHLNALRGSEYLAQMRGCASKHAFASKRKAMARARVLREKYGTRTFRAYKCQHCGAWHLSKTARTR